jgi:hypothetical protein
MLQSGALTLTYGHTLEYYRPGCLESRGLVVRSALWVLRWMSLAFGLVLQTVDFLHKVLDQS